MMDGKLYDELAWAELRPTVDKIGGWLGEQDLGKGQTLSALLVLVALAFDVDGAEPSEQAKRVSDDAMKLFDCNPDAVPLVLCRLARLMIRADKGI